MYNYAGVEYSSNIETPPDTWSPDKVDESAYEQMEKQRNKDMQMQQTGSGPKI
jgi:recombinational DNA repair ATPase RecF